MPDQRGCIMVVEAMTNRLRSICAGKCEGSRPYLSAITGGESLVMNPGEVLPVETARSFDHRHDRAADLSAWCAQDQ